MAISVQQWITKMDARMREATDEKILKAVIMITISEVVPRIFDKGLKSDGADIGKYSTKETYISNRKESTPKKFIPLGKFGKSKFKNGNIHKSRFFKAGYKEFKELIGRGGRVNLRLFDELKFDVSAPNFNKGGLRKITNGVEWFLKKEINIKKREGLEEKYGKIFNLTPTEKALFVKRYKEEVLKIFTK